MADKGFFSNLKGKVALITGASGGIGGATACEFAKQGVCLALHGRDVEKLTQVQQHCVNLGLKKENVLVITVELLNVNDVTKMAEDVLKYFGNLDILVNNAGDGIHHDVDSTTFEDLDKMFHIHVKVPLQLVQLFKDSVIKNKGAIINVASISGVVGIPNELPYSIAKAAMIQLTANLNIDLGPKGVRCNTVSPGPIDNNFVITGSFVADPDQKAELYKRLSKWIIAGRPGKNEEVANAILYLASDASSYMMGQNLVLDGGLTNARLLNCAHLLSNGQ